MLYLVILAIASASMDAEIVHESDGGKAAAVTDSVLDEAADNSGISEEDMAEIMRISEEDKAVRDNFLDGDRELALRLQAQFNREVPDEQSLLKDALKALRPVVAPLIGSYIMLCIIARVTPSASNFLMFTASMLAGMASANGFTEPNGYMRTGGRDLLMKLQVKASDNLNSIRRRLRRP